jgi:tetratricopeptide (TPR) repeat protein
MAIARLERAVALLDRGDARGAAAEAAKAKELAPRAPGVREVLGLALYQLERYPEALSEMQAYRRMSGRADQNHIIADSLRSLGRPDRAVPLAEEALASRGVPLAAKAEAVIVASSALADQGKFDQALGMLRRIRTRDDVAGPEVMPRLVRDREHPRAGRPASRCASRVPQDPPARPERVRRRGARVSARLTRALGLPCAPPVAEDPHRVQADAGHRLHRLQVELGLGARRRVGAERRPAGRA